MYDFFRMAFLLMSTLDRNLTSTTSFFVFLILLWLRDYGAARQDAVLAMRLAERSFKDGYISNLKFSNLTSFWNARVPSNEVRKKSVRFASNGGLW
jgi:hypothetical protein